MGPKYTWLLIVVLLSSRGILSAVAQQRDGPGWGVAAGACFGGYCLSAFESKIMRGIEHGIRRWKKWRRRKSRERVQRKQQKKKAPFMTAEQAKIARAELERKKRKEMEQVSGWFVEGVDDDSVREGNASFAEENELEPDILDLDDIED
jgi:hypothetical protein